MKLMFAQQTHVAKLEATSALSLTCAYAMNQPSPISLRWGTDSKEGG